MNLLNITNPIISTFFYFQFIQIFFLPSSALLPAPTTASLFDALVDDDDMVHVLSYNVWGLPINLPGHDQEERFRQLPQIIKKSRAEIICLQEVFNPSIRKKLVNHMSSDYFLGSDYMKDKTILGPFKKDLHGGLMTLSKFPIIQEAFYTYKTDKKYSIIEKIGAKGFLFTTILRNGQPINIINTHLYAGNNDQAEKRRMEQIKFLMNTLESLPEYHLYPSILMGDLNVSPNSSSEVYEYVTHEWQDCFDNKKTLYTIDPSNPYISSEEPMQKLDHIMISDNNAFSPIQSKLSFDNHALSDHYGIESVLYFNPTYRNVTSKYANTIIR